MDPDVLLDEIRALLAQEDEADPAEVADIHAEIAVKVRDLDQWLSGGGFLPRAWEQHTPTEVLTWAPGDPR